MYLPLTSKLQSIAPPQVGARSSGFINLVDLARGLLGAPLILRSITLDLRLRPGRTEQLMSTLMEPPGAMCTMNHEIFTLS